jgi:hypothetical protein
MVEIPLTQGQTALVDDEDAELVLAFKWCAAWRESSKTYYAVRGLSPAISGTGGYVQVYMHRSLVGLESGDRRMVDHRDRNGLNNTRQNLRVCTRSRNVANSIGNPSRRLSRFKGVSRSDNGQGWCAQIIVNRKRIRLGTFPTEEAAALAYDAAAVEHFGQFALTNVALSPELLVKGGAA